MCHEHPSFEGCLLQKQQYSHCTVDIKKLTIFKKLSVTVQCTSKLQLIFVLIKVEIKHANELTQASKQANANERHEEPLRRARVVPLCREGSNC